MEKDKALQKIVNTLYITSQSVPYGLLTGQMGIILFLYRYARYSGISAYSDLADALVDNIYSFIETKRLPGFFAEGLSGIGWGLNYLVQEKYLEADEDALEEIDENILKMKKEEFVNDMNEEIPLFSKGLYFTAREHREGVQLSLYELEEFLESVSIDALPLCYLVSIRYFLRQAATRKIEEEKSLFLLGKLPYSDWKQYWNPLLYNERGVVDEKITGKEIDNIIADIHYKRLGLHNGLAGLGMLLCP